MTIFSLILIGVVAFIGLIIAIGVGTIIYQNNDTSKTTIARAISSGVAIAAIAAAICCGIVWWQLNTASGQRAYKDQTSNINGGLERVVSVYDVDGDLIAEYDGKFDVETDNSSYILFDDENGARHIIYYTTGTVIIDEK